MAGVGYRKGNYATYNEWDSDKDDWNKTSYGQNGYSDHVRLQVIDYEERRKPAISYYPNPNKEGFVTETKTVKGTIHAPTVIKYEYSYPTIVDTEQIFKDNGPKDKIWQSASSPVHDRPHKFDQELQSKVNFIRNLGRRSSSPVHDLPQKGTIDYDTMKEQPSVTKEGWKSKVNTPPGHPLTKPTNDIRTAVGFPKEAVVKPPVVTADAPQPRFSLPVSRTKNVPGLTTKEDAYTETIDSRESIEKYKGILV